ncbi:hypothetical protein BDZ97DRAFT_1752457 [Flammula alnicola]|nr:hypothetical protein BDZ97DRAFT_1752457 [Flammula alnicola]
MTNGSEEQAHGSPGMWVLGREGYERFSRLNLTAMGVRHFQLKDDEENNKRGDEHSLRKERQTRHRPGTQFDPPRTIGGRRPENENSEILFVSWILDGQRQFYDRTFIVSKWGRIREKEGTLKEVLQTSLSTALCSSWNMEYFVAAGIEFGHYIGHKLRPSPASFCPRRPASIGVTDVTSPSQGGSKQSGVQDNPTNPQKGIRSKRIGICKDPFFVVAVFSLKARAVMNYGKDMQTCEGQDEEHTHLHLVFFWPLCDFKPSDRQDARIGGVLQGPNLKYQGGAQVAKMSATAYTWCLWRRRLSFAGEESMFQLRVAWAITLAHEKKVLLVDLKVQEDINSMLAGCANPLHNTKAPRQLNDKSMINSGPKKKNIPLKMLLKPGALGLLDLDLSNFQKYHLEEIVARRGKAELELRAEAEQEFEGVAAFENQLPIQIRNPRPSTRYFDRNQLFRSKLRLKKTKTLFRFDSPVLTVIISPYNTSSNFELENWHLTFASWTAYKLFGVDLGDL